jgi:hypothetical protein
MGLAGLTAVFGMGTGVTPPVWSPGKSPAGLCAPPGSRSVRRPKSFHRRWNPPTGSSGRFLQRDVSLGEGIAFSVGSLTRPNRADFSAPSRGGQAAWLLGPVGCGARASCTPGLST